MKKIIVESNEILIGGHRGCKCSLQENTIGAFKAGIEKGAHYLETDVQMTQDGVLVLWHDETFEGRYIMDTTFDEVKRTGRVETFENLLIWLKESGSRATIELKNIPMDDKRLVAAVVEKVRGYDIFNQVILMSFDHHIIKEVKEMEPGITTSIVAGSKVVDPVGLVIASSADIFNTNIERLTPSMVRELKERNIIVSGGFVKNEFLHRVLELGVDMFDTDYPETAKEYLREYM